MYDKTWNPSKQMDWPRTSRGESRAVGVKGDIFRPDIPVEVTAAVFQNMSHSRHRFILVTGHPDRALAFLKGCGNGGGLGWITHNNTEPKGAYRGTGIIVGGHDNWPPPNVWVGFPVCNQADLDNIGPDIMRVAALGWPVWISYEPALGPVDWNRPIEIVPDRRGRVGIRVNPMTGQFQESGVVDPQMRIQGIVVGGESGPNARPMHPDWARSARDQCAEAGVKCFHKQNGEWVAGSYYSAAGCGSHPTWPEYAYGAGGELICLPDGKVRRNPTPTRPLESVFLRVGKEAAGRELDGVKSTNADLPWRNVK